MIRSQFALAVVVLAALVAGCGGNGDGDDAPAAGENSTTTEAASVGQVAGVVAKGRADLLEKLDEAGTCVLFPQDCDITSSLAVLSVSIQSKTLGITLGGIDDDRPNNGHYIGAYPDELVDLVEETLAAAAEAEQTGSAWSAACSGDGAGAACRSVALSTSSAFSSLEDALLAWEPYL